MNENIKKKDNIVIPWKAMAGIAPAISITALLISKHQPGQLLLFWVGISCGFLIAKGFFKK